MEKEKMKLLLDYIEEEQKNLYITDYIREEDFLEIKNMDELTQYFDEINECGDITIQEILYYESAMEFLKKNDITLKQSLKIAGEYGYDFSKLDSESLATILATKINEIEYSKIVGNILEYAQDIGLFNEEEK